MSGECEKCGEHILDCLCKSRLQKFREEKELIHECFKERLTDMALNLIYDFTHYYSDPKGDDEMMDVYEFIEKWVGKHVKDMRENL